MGKIEVTLAMVKSHATAAGHAADIIFRASRAGLVAYTPVNAMRQLTTDEAAQFYYQHVGRPYYGDLIESVTKSPVLVVVLSGVNAIARWRRLLGATDPEQALPGCIRGDYGWLLPDNAAHGSDSPESAAYEIKLLVPEYPLSAEENSSSAKSE